MDSKLNLRHFILAKDFKLNRDSQTFTAKNIYEFIVSEQYPAYINFKAIIGLCFLKPDKDYTVIVNVLQNEKILSRWNFEEVKVERINEIGNFFLDSHGKFTIKEEGFLQFDIIVNGELINTQYVQAVVGEVK